MAITQLAANSTNPVFKPTTSGTDAITLLAGSNRAFVFYLAGFDLNSSGSAPAEAFPTITYGGVALEPMLRDDGALARLSVAGVFSRTYGMIYWLRNAQLPANGSQNLVVSWPGLSGTSSWAWRGIAYQLQNVDQNQVVRDHRRFSNASGVASPLSGTTQPGGASDALIVGGTNGTAVGTTDIEIAGSPTTEDLNQTLGGARVAVSRQLAAGAAAGILTRLVYSTTGSGSVLIAARLAEFFAPNGRPASLSSEPATGCYLYSE